MSQTSKKMLTKMAVAVMSLMMLFGNAMPAHAASSVTGSIDGTTAKASISTTSSSATAKTTYSRGTATIKTTASVYYWSEKKHYYTSASASSSGGGATAVATKKRGGAEVTGGKGTHSIKYGSYTWTPSTSTGSCPSDSIKE